MSTCEKHEEIREQLRDHEKRIVALEKADAEFAIRLQNLIEKIDNLTGWIKALVVSITGTTGPYTNRCNMADTVSANIYTRRRD